MKSRIPRRKVQIRFTRSSGAGGQNVNKVETKVHARLKLSDLDVDDDVRARIARNLGRRVDAMGRVTVVSSKYRLQSHNIRDALERMEALIDAAAKPTRRRVPTKTSRAAKLERLARKKLHGRKKKERRKRVEED